MLNFLLSRFRWWRRFKGGIWWYVELPAMGESHRWVNTEPQCNEAVYHYENFTKLWTFGVLSEREFLQQVVNISRNGMWKDDLNLGKYIYFARTLRDLGIDDGTIIRSLTSLYSAACMETTSGLESRDFSWEELQEMIRRKESN